MRLCLATRVLEALEIPSEALSEHLLAMLETGLTNIVSELAAPPRGEKAFELALHGTIALNPGYLGTKHLLLGITREGSGAASRTLAELGATPKVRERQVAALSAPTP